MPDVVGELVSLVDLMPTIIDVLGYEIPKGIQGQSLLEFAPGRSRELISESFPIDFLVDYHPRFDRIERAIFSGPYKFISSTSGKRELYNLSEDADEKENLYDADNDVSKALEAQLNQWLNSVEAESSLPAKLDRDALDRLKALGYVN